MRSIHIAFRNLINSDRLSFLNFAGLSIGIFSSLVLALFIWAEFSRDTFLPDYKKIYRLTTQYRISGNDANWALNHGIIDHELEQKLSGIENSTAFIGISSEKIFYTGNLSATSSRGFYVDEDFFEVLPFEFSSGNRTNALDLPNSIVVTSSFAKKLFGTTDVLNKEVFEEPNEKSPLVITGVVSDLPNNSYIKFDYLVSGKSYAHWDQYYSGKSGNMFYIFFKTINEENVGELQTRVDRSLTEVKKELLGQDYEPSDNYRLNNVVQRIDKIYFNANNEFEISAGGNFNYTLLILMVAIFVLMICIINHINLNISSSFSKKKIKEFAVKKLVGSSRTDLILSFIVEVSISVLGALIISLLLLRFLIDLWPEVQRTIINPFGSIEFYLALIFGWMLISVLTALFPALKFMSFNIIQASKGSLNTQTSGFWSARHALVVVQVVVTVLLLTNSSLLFRQLNHLVNLDPGYDTHQIIEVKRTSNLTNAQWNNFLNNVKNLSSVVSVGSSTFAHISDVSNATITADIPESPRVKVAWNGIDYDFLKTLKMDIIQGRSFDRNYSSDTAEVILNERAVNDFGLTNPVGESVIMWGRPLKIIGIINNFHFQSFTKPISPTLLLLNDGNTSIAYIKHQTSSGAAVRSIENEWYKLNPESPFEFAFMNDNYESLVEKEKQTASLVTAFTLVAIILASLGLIGLVGNEAIQKTKEIAIKKILGAPIKQIIYLINRRFAIILLIGFLISIPLAILSSNYWLQLFAYRVSISNTDFILSLILIGIVGTVVSSIITFGAATSNPVRVIRNNQ